MTPHQPLRAWHSHADVAMPHPRAFSLVEMLIALAISAMVLVASLSALDALFKSYQATSERASTHIVARMVMYRIMTMIRTGEQFAPYPTDVLNPTENPLVTHALEFVSFFDPATGDYHITRLERRDAAPYTIDSTSYELRGPYVLWLEVHKFPGAGGPPVIEEMPLLDGLQDITFTLKYDVGPRLRRATMDMVVRTNTDVHYEVDGGEGAVEDNIGFMSEAPPVRLVSSVSPRRLN